MPEEVVPSEEDKKVLEDEKSEETKSEEDKSGFAKEGETVAPGKYNQALRKAREAEIEKRRLEKELEDAKKEKPAVEEKEEEDDFFKDTEEKKEETPDVSKIVDERLKPINEALKKREESDKKLQRTAFFEAHPEYLNNAEKFQELLDEMDNSINPNSPDDYYTQLEKTHSILSGVAYDATVEDKKKEIAGAAASSGDGAEKNSVKEEFTADDRRIMKEQNVSEDAMRALKKKLESGSMRIL